MSIGEPDLKQLHHLRTWVSSRAKLLWGFGVSLGYLAIVAVPIAWSIGWQGWVGPLGAVVFAISGRICVWRSENYREDAEWTIRAIELSRGIGYKIDAAKLARVKLKYVNRLPRQGPSVSYDDYYEASGEPSHSLLIRMERESAWWTEQLAKKASLIVFIVTGAALVVSVSAITLGGLEVQDERATMGASGILRRSYGLAISLLVLLDAVNLGTKYHRLSVAAEESMKRLTELLDRVGSVSNLDVILAVSGYQWARKEGPLIPDSLKRYYEEPLQRVWNDTLSRTEDRD